MVGRALISNAKTKTGKKGPTAFYGFSRHLAFQGSFRGVSRQYKAMESFSLMGEGQTRPDLGHVYVYVYVTVTVAVLLL